MAHKAKSNTPQSFAAPSPHYRFTSIKQSPKVSGTPDSSEVSEGMHSQQVPRSRWLSVKKMAQIYCEVTSEAALRNLIWQAEAWEKFPKAGLRSNGFLPVIVRPPNQRKVLLDRTEFEKWLTTQQKFAVSK